MWSGLDRPRISLPSYRSLIEISVLYHLPFTTLPAALQGSNPCLSIDLSTPHSWRLPLLACAIMRHEPACGPRRGGRRQRVDERPDDHGASGSSRLSEHAVANPAFAASGSTRWTAGATIPATSSTAIRLDDSPSCRSYGARGQFSPSACSLHLVRLRGPREHAGGDALCVGPESQPRRASSAPKMRRVRLCLLRHAGLDQIHRLGNCGSEPAISIHVYGIERHAWPKLLEPAVGPQSRERGSGA